MTSYTSIPLETKSIFKNVVNREFNKLSGDMWDMSYAGLYENMCAYYENLRDTYTKGGELND